MPRLTCQSLQWAWRVISSHAAEKLDTKQFKLDYQNRWFRPTRAQTLFFFNSRCIRIWELSCSVVTWSSRRPVASMLRNAIHSARTAVFVKKENAVAAQITMVISANTKVAQAAPSRSSFSFSLSHWLQQPLVYCTLGITCRKSKQQCQQMKPKEVTESNNTRHGNS